MGRLDSLINAYASLVYGDKGLTNNAVVDPIQAAKEILKQEITSEIREKYKEEIYSEVKQQVRCEQEQDKVSQIKAILIETVFLSALVGLIVNQMTDVITYLKEGITIASWQIVCLTLGFVVAFFVAMVILIQVRYVNGISKIIRNLST